MTFCFNRAILYNDNAEDFFKSLPKTLKILKLRHCTLSKDQAVALFKRLPSLKDLHTLDLSFIILGDLLSPNAFAKCFPESLEILDLSECEIKGDQSKILLETMSKLKKLEEVHLNGNKHIDCTTLEKLKNLPNLKRLDLSECEITCDQSKILLETMSKLKKLEEVHLNGNKHIDCTTLLEKLENLPNLKRLFIRDVVLPEKRNVVLSEIREHFNNPSKTIHIEIDREDEKSLPESNDDFLKPIVYFGDRRGNGDFEWCEWNFQKKSSGQKS